MSSRSSVCKYIEAHVCVYVFLQNELWIHGMYVCMYVRIYACMYVRMYVCMYDGLHCKIRFRECLQQPVLLYGKTCWAGHGRVGRLWGLMIHTHKHTHTRSQGTNYKDGITWWFALQSLSTSPFPCWYTTQSSVMLASFANVYVALLPSSHTYWPLCLTRPTHADPSLSKGCGLSVHMRVNACKGSKSQTSHSLGVKPCIRHLKKTTTFQVSSICAEHLITFFLKLTRLHELVQTMLLFCVGNSCKLAAELSAIGLSISSIQWHSFIVGEFLVWHHCRHPKKRLVVFCADCMYRFVVCAFLYGRFRRQRENDAGSHGDEKKSLHVGKKSEEQRGGQPQASNWKTGNKLSYMYSQYLARTSTSYLNTEHNLTSYCKGLGISLLASWGSRCTIILDTCKNLLHACRSSHRSKRPCLRLYLDAFLCCESACNNSKVSSKISRRRTETSMWWCVRSTEAQGRLKEMTRFGGNLQ